MIGFVCMKWGTAFGPEYVNILYSAAQKNCSRRFRFYCLTDNAEGLHPDIVVRPLPAFAGRTLQDIPGCWPKLGVFEKGVFQDEEVVFFIDLDVMINGPLDEIIDHALAKPGFHIIREWNPSLWSLVPLRLRPHRGAQSSVFAFRPAECHYLYEEFAADPDKWLARARNDQMHLYQNVRDLQFWPHHWFASFKRSCVWYFPLSLIFRNIPRPREARIIVFHGKPRPVDLIREGRYRWGASRKFGYGPVAWVQDYWREHNRRIEG